MKTITKVVVGFVCSLALKWLLAKEQIQATTKYNEEGGIESYNFLLRFVLTLHPMTAAVLAGILCWFSSSSY